METDCTLPQCDFPPYRVPNPHDPYVADLLQVADARIEDLEVQLQRLEDENTVMDRKLKTFRQQVMHTCTF